MTALEDRITKLQTERQKELDQINDKYKREQDAISADLKNEISRLSSELKATQKAYQKFTGKTAVRTPLPDGAAEGNSNRMLKETLLSFFDDGQEHRARDFEEKAQQLGYKKNSVASNLARFVKSGQLQRVKNGLYRKAFAVAAAAKKSQLRAEDHELRSDVTY